MAGFASVEVVVEVEPSFLNDGNQPHKLLARGKGGMQLTPSSWSRIGRGESSDREARGSQRKFFAAILLAAECMVNVVRAPRRLLAPPALTRRTSRKQLHRDSATGRFEISSFVGACCHLLALSSWHLVLL